MEVKESIVKMLYSAEIATLVMASYLSMSYFVSKTIEMSAQLYLIMFVQVKLGQHY